MKRSMGLYILSVASLLFLFSGLLAQEKVEVSVTITEDGKVVTDTTYQFEDVTEARHALKMMNYTFALSEGGHSKAMVFISEDGQKTEIKEIHEDSLVWMSEKEADGDQVKVMKYKLEEGKKPHGEHVIVIKSDEGDTFDILVDEDSEGNKVVRRKEVKVLVSEDEDVTWHVEGDDEVKMKVMKIMEDEGEDEDVKVIVIKKGEKDPDLDEDADHDEEVEVKVIKKKVK